MGAIAAAHPKREVLKVPHQDVSWSAQDLQEQTDALAAGLIEIGYKRGTKLALWIANETEHLAAVLAASKVGCVLVTIDPAASADTVKEVLKAEGCRGLMFGQRFRGEHRGQAAAGITDLEDWHWGDMVSDKSMRSLRHLINTGHEVIEGIMQYKHFPVYNPMPDPLPMVRQQLSGDDVLLVPYGADGARGEALTQADLIKTAKAAAGEMGLTKEDVVCVAAWQHSRFGLAAGSLAAMGVGSKVVIPSREEDGDAALAAVATHGVTALVGSGASLAEATATYDVSSVRTALVDGEGAPAALGGVKTVSAAAVQSGAALA